VYVRGARLEHSPPLYLHQLQHLLQPAGTEISGLIRYLKATQVQRFQVGCEVKQLPQVMKIHSWQCELAKGGADGRGGFRRGGQLNLQLHACFAQGQARELGAAREHLFGWRRRKNGCLRLETETLNLRSYGKEPNTLAAGSGCGVGGLRKCGHVNFCTIPCLAILPTKMLELSQR